MSATFVFLEKNINSFLYLVFKISLIFSITLGRILILEELEPIIYFYFRINFCSSHSANLPFISNMQLFSMHTESKYIKC